MPLAVIDGNAQGITKRRETISPNLRGLPRKT